jgi:hypothetical protein
MTLNTRSWCLCLPFFPSFKGLANKRFRMKTKGGGFVYERFAFWWMVVCKRGWLVGWLVGSLVGGGSCWCLVLAKQCENEAGIGKLHRQTTPWRFFDLRCFQNRLCESMNKKEGSRGEVILLALPIIHPIFWHIDLLYENGLFRIPSWWETRT